MTEVRSAWTDMLEDYERRKQAYDDEQHAYEQELERAGYGEAARRSYIEAGDPDFNEAEWDENIIPAAEASGELPERPMRPLHPYEQITIDAGHEAMGESLREHPTRGLFDMTPEQARQHSEHIDRRTSEIRAARIKALRDTPAAQRSEGAGDVKGVAQADISDGPQAVPPDERHLLRPLTGHRSHQPPEVGGPRRGL
ncbi:hypothetical protein [Phytoactinopolyspora mesophila]|uniref:Uncharacterized protein n=1 Tax=Phytoactinopolyspora mesophila TaxID=2650750 RepID=A0A7K3M153_9ACTN|nr:hypothetical protein [Phytoactinopolyspora mesophila]NDL57004.1 hypothetical protein [Phytoactinopolyspora mesophila]